MTQQVTSEDLQEEGEPAGRASRVEHLDSVVIRFAGDSGDGIQLSCAEFSRLVASGGFAFVTRSDYPAEIRAPAGSLYGVSAPQIQYSKKVVFTSGEDTRAGHH